MIEIIVVSRYRLYGDCEFCFLDTFAEFPVVLYLIYKYAFINFDFLFYSKVLQDGFIFGARLDASLCRFWDRISSTSELANIYEKFFFSFFLFCFLFLLSCSCC